MTEPTAVYSMPRTNQFYQVTGPETSISEQEVLEQPGFIFAPFDPSSEAVYRISGQPVPMNIQDLARIQWRPASRQITGDDWYSYLNMYQDAMDSIRDGNCEKIVLSLRDIEDHPIRSVGTFLQNLRVSYPDAFVYLFYIPGKELWMGATPELLLDTHLPVQHTAALAGTLKNAPEWEDWPEKERQEHRFVERYVEEVLEGSHFRKEGPKPVAAGPVFHLLTDYYINHSDGVPYQIVNPFQLHPGPALSGYPVPESVAEIKRIERLPRRYYTGYLGPVWDAGRSSVFINLRCLEMLSEYSVLYAGGGLTPDSDPENEWMEIQHKLSTLRTKIYKVHQTP